MKDYEINVPDIKLNYWYSHWQQTVVIRGPRPPKKTSLPRPSLTPFTGDKPLVKRMHMDKVNWIIVHNYDKPKFLFFRSSSSWEGKILEPDIDWDNEL